MTVFEKRSQKSAKEWVATNPAQADIDAAIVRAAQKGHPQAITVILPHASAEAIASAKHWAGANGKANALEALDGKRFAKMTPTMHRYRAPSPHHDWVTGQWKDEKKEFFAENPAGEVVKDGFKNRRDAEKWIADHA